MKFSDFLPETKTHPVMREIIEFVEAARRMTDHVKRAPECINEDTTIVEVTLHPSGLWTGRYIKDDPFVLYEVPLN